MIDYMHETKIYLIKEVKIEINERLITIESLVHEQGLKRVLEKSTLPMGLGEIVGKPCTVSFDRFYLQGRFSKEVTSLGTFYNVKFLQISPFERKRIADEVRLRGLPAPWRRRFARISTSGKEGDLPVPFLALGKGRWNKLYFNVVNFTIGGLMLETPDGAEFEPRLNEEILFDLVTTGGDKIENMKGIIMHIDEDVNEREDTRQLLFGIRMMPLNLVNEVKYNAIIRDYLLAYKRRSSLA